MSSLIDNLRQSGLMALMMAFGELEARDAGRVFDTRGIYPVEAQPPTNNRLFRGEGKRARRRAAAKGR